MTELNIVRANCKRLGVEFRKDLSSAESRKERRSYYQLGSPGSPLGWIAFHSTEGHIVESYCYEEDHSRPDVERVTLWNSIVFVESSRDTN